MTVLEIIRIICASMLALIAFVGIVSFLMLCLAGQFEKYSDKHDIKEGGFMDFMIDYQDVFFEASMSCAVGLLVGTGALALLFA